MKHLFRYFLCTLIAVANTLYVTAQTHRIDSLQNELKKSTKDTVTVSLFTALANEYFAYDTVKALQYLEQGYLLAKKMKWNYAIGDYYQIKGISKQFSSDHELAHLLFDTAIIYFNKTINSKRPKEEIENVFCGPSSAFLPFSFSGLPIVKLPP